MKRIKKLLQLMGPKQAYLITKPVDIYYLTGLDISTGSLVLAQDHCFLLVDGRYFEACKKNSPIPVYLTKEGLFFELIKDKDTLVVDGDHTSHSSFLKLQESGKNIQSTKSLTEALRAIKDSEEIRLLKEASNLGLEGFDHALTLLKTGITEAEVAYELEYFWRKKGSQGVAFEPIIAFGANSAMPHYRAGNGVLKEGDIVLIDIGVKKNHYHSDMTRVYFWGQVNPKLHEIHQIVEEAIRSALSKVKAGVLVKEVDATARKLITDRGYGNYFTHSLGHGVGLEIHEYPWVKSGSPFGDVSLEEGMVITIEPGIYLPELGGVRLEDTVIVKKNGYENLTERVYA